MNNKHPYLRVILPAAVIGTGLAVSAMISLPCGVILIGAGIAIVAFGKACGMFDPQIIAVADRHIR